MIKVLIVDDHEMFAEGTIRLLAEDPDILVIGAVTTAGEAIAAARALQPEIVLMDFALPDVEGAEGIRLMKECYPAAKVITVTGSEQAGSYHAATDAGASAWVRKTSAARDLRMAIYRVYHGDPVPEDELSMPPRLDQLADPRVPGRIRP